MPGFYYLVSQDFFYVVVLQKDFFVQHSTFALFHLYVNDLYRASQLNNVTVLCHCSSYGAFYLTVPRVVYLSTVFQVVL